ncbi:MAG: ABC transporter permease [Bdellovibrionia bacterium]
MKLTYIGGALIALMLIAALFAPLIATHDPGEMNLPKQFESPSSEHYFGLDQNGSDIFSRAVYGARISLGVAISVVSVSVLIGLLLGSISGYLEGWPDMLLMRFIDMLHAFPGFLLAIALVAVLGPSIKNLIFAMCLTGWTGYARLVRAEILHLKQRDYVLAARATGAGPVRVVLLHLWPNLVGPLTVQATFGMAGTILTESGLSFLGLGAPPSEPTWGSLLNAGRRALVEAPHLSLFPGLAIFLLVLGFNLFGDGLRDLLDPKKT